MIEAKILKPAHVAAGLTLVENDDHTVSLLHHNARVYTWVITSSSPTIVDIHTAADKITKGVTTL